MQVTLEYDDDKLVRVDTIIISLQHDIVDEEMLRDDIKREVIDKVVDNKLLINTRIFINPTGRFVIGGPVGDTG